MPLVSVYIAIITLNVYRMNSPIKGHRVDGWIEKKKTLLYAPYKRLTTALRTCKLKMKGCKKIFLAGGNQKKAGIATLISDKIPLSQKQ